YLNVIDSHTGTRGRGWTECGYSAASGTSCDAFNPKHQAIERSWPSFAATMSANGTSYQLDRFGRVLSQTMPIDPTAKVELQRDGLGRVIQVQRPSGSAQSLPYVSKRAYSGRTVTTTSERSV